jgi:hypothetical protein
MTRLSLEPQDYERTRSHFRDCAARLALFREALIEHGFSEDAAGRFCDIWLHWVLHGEDEDEED